MRYWFNPSALCRSTELIKLSLQFAFARVATFFIALVARGSSELVTAANAKGNATFPTATIARVATLSIAAGEFWSRKE
jgi:hypothetical protein